LNQVLISGQDTVSTIALWGNELYGWGQRHTHCSRDKYILWITYDDYRLNYAPFAGCLLFRLYTQPWRLVLTSHWAKLIDCAILKSR